MAMNLIEFWQIMVQHIETLAEIFKDRGLSAPAKDLEEVAKAYRGKTPELIEGVTIYDRSLRGAVRYYSKFIHNLELRTVVVENGEEKRLSPTENRLLTELGERPYRLRYTSELVRKVFGEERSMKNLQWYISSLRKKVEPDPKHPEIIINVRSQGYMLNDSSKE
jgi:DNA-binding response OmpR family regulator